MLDKENISFPLVGYICGTHGWGNRYAHSHFADIDGGVACGADSRTRFGMDCSTEIHLRSMEDFDLEISVSNRNPYKNNDRFKKGHLPLDNEITCKRCRTIISKTLAELKAKYPYLYYKEDNGSITGIPVDKIGHFNCGYIHLAGRTGLFSWITANDLHLTREAAEASNIARFLTDANDINPINEIPNQL